MSDVNVVNGSRIENNIRSRFNFEVIQRWCDKERFVSVETPTAIEVLRPTGIVEFNKSTHSPCKSGASDIDKLAWRIQVSFVEHCRITKTAWTTPVRCFRHCSQTKKQVEPFGGGPLLTPRSAKPIHSTA